ncbi:hypothetical protein SEVIR_8G083100v4 [Setaria viridis]|nr:probable protein phosphatase 2C 74 [Setaria italica]XP_034569485.1 probable protein phosphatase 2C 74 [Setaria viridis]RCV37666.1 hypothetical protein SETIT_8G081700v2 [Setaria italica]TKW00039.1 hypothetical protein SEVIR_8G083100v2 [Setaria viridis]
MLQTIRFLCSVVAAFARLVGELRKALMAVKASPAGLISATPLALRRKAAPDHAIQKQQGESKKTKKEAWAARRRPARLVIPVADDAGEVAAGWGAAAAPVKEADVEVAGEGFCVASRAGPRHAMEDAYSVLTHKNDGDSDQLAFYGVFDGHGGRAAVDFVSERLGKNVVSAVLAAGTDKYDEASSAEEHDAVSAAIRAAYLATDSELLVQHQHQGLSGGACGTTALVRNGDLFVAHVGDCRAVLSRDGGAAAALTADHTCAAEGERERIERGGGYVSRSGSGVWRVQGSLAVSRSFGDCGLKRWVVAEPAVTRVPLVAGCEFLVVASDGLWDKVSNQEVVDAVSRSRSRVAACGELVELARRRGSRDDVTVMVIDLERFVRQDPSTKS